MLKTASSLALNGTTGTGSVVLSDGPTINNPTLTGVVSANVNLRSGTLATLLPLAGGSSEIGYATDARALVKFNGVAGEAEVLGTYGDGTTLNFLLTDASYAANQITPIDCTNISLLKIIYTADFTGSYVENINIKLPSSEFEPQLTVQFLSASLGIFLNDDLSPGTITLSYNTYDITNATNVYIPIAADEGGVIPSFSGQSNVDNLSLWQVTFFPKVLQGWTRTSRQGEAYQLEDLDSGFDSASNSSVLGRYVIDASTNGVSLVSNTTTNLGPAIDLPIGVWSISGKVDFKSTNSLLSISEFSAELFSSVNTGAIVVSNIGAISQRVVITNIANNKILSFALPTIVIQNTGSVAPTIPYYNRVIAVFTGGTVVPTIQYTAVRIA